MKKEKVLDKLDQLTLEADMLSGVMDDALKIHDYKEGIMEISYLSEIIRRKFRKIRNLF